MRIFPFAINKSSFDRHPMSGHILLIAHNPPSKCYLTHKFYLLEIALFQIQISEMQDASCEHGADHLT